MDKEFVFFSTIYKYQYRNYLFLMVVDRTIYILITLASLIFFYNLRMVSLLMMSIVATILALDISSAVSVKLLANMSFVSYYHTILQFQMNNLKLATLFKIKMKFF
ncbi:MAG: hypothetical protein ACK5KR_01375 [Breznakia sp.]